MSSQEPDRRQQIINLIQDFEETLKEHILLLCATHQAARILRLKVLPAAAPSLNHLLDIRLDTEIPLGALEPTLTSRFYRGIIGPTEEPIITEAREHMRALMAGFVRDMQNRFVRITYGRYRTLTNLIASIGEIRELPETTDLEPTIAGHLTVTQLDEAHRVLSENQEPSDYVWEDELVPIDNTEALLRYSRDRHRRREQLQPSDPQFSAWQRAREFGKNLGMPPPPQVKPPKPRTWEEEFGEL